jgi:NAD(P)H-flavin reductase
MRLVNVASPAEKLPIHRVQKVRQLSATTYVIRLDRKNVDFKPGQYFIINEKGSFEAREYTIYSSMDDDYLDFIIVEVSREEGGKFHGRVTDYIRQYPVDPAMLFYLCGNCGMLFEVYDILVDQGVARQSINTEVFY